MSAERDRELAELLPWLVNGTLSGAVRSEVEDLVKRSPDAAAELHLWKAVHAEVRREAVDSGVDMGWRRFERQLRKPESSGQAMRLWRMAAAVAAVTIISLQSVVLWQGARDAELRQMSGPAPVVSANEWRVQVRFAQAATASQIQALLLHMDARIINGPSALGLYDVAVTRNERFADPAVVLNWLREQPIVEEVALPPIAKNQGGVP